MGKILIVPDKFKGSLTAEEVSTAIANGILQCDASAKVSCIPLADGGEGMVEAMVAGLEGTMVDVKVHDPLMRQIDSSYGISCDGKIAFIEMAKASGLMLLNKNEQNPYHTTSYGTGEMIAHAIEKGVNKIYLGIGGSASNDAGLGMLAALGINCFGVNGELIDPVGGNLQSLKGFDHSRRLERIDDVEFILMSDVSNPLYGENGAANVFAAQKGASPAEIERLDAGLRHFAGVIERSQGINISDIPGAGAGGGLAAGALVLLNAKIKSGIHVLMDVLALAMMRELSSDHF